MQNLVDSDRCNGCPARQICTALKGDVIVMDDSYEHHKKYKSRKELLSALAEGWNAYGYPGQEPCPALVGEEKERLK